MILLACVDDRFGMLFNHRRQSSDRAVIDKILEISKGNRIWMDSYSLSLFPTSANIYTNINFLDKASLGEYCFVERTECGQYLSRVEKIVLFQWNRKYPADLFFPKALLDSAWRLVQTSDFAGFSHDRITMEVYEP